MELGQNYGRGNLFPNGHMQGQEGNGKM